MRLPNLVGDTSRLSPLLLNCQKKVTSGGFAVTEHRTRNASSNCAPKTCGDVCMHTGASI